MADEAVDYTFEAFAQHDFYRTVNEHLVDLTLQVRERLAQSPVHRAVDLACGTGAVTQVLVDRVRRLREPVEVIAVDPSESALEKARRLVGSAARFVRGTAQAFSNVVGSVDVIVFCNAIHLLPDKERVMREARRSLNKQGVLGFNTSFYEGCYAPGTERFYKLWMLRALQLLKQEEGLKPDRSKVEAMRWLTPEEYRALLQDNGFDVVDMRTEEARMTCESWQDISHYSEFATGALPGVPVDVAIPILQRSVAQAYDELKIETLPRNWLQVVARAR
ncbi:MAG TPA: methyltransferase domain-containing protein [Chloroflexota bacterium]|nr:methyltransferase domain-containing protein [Chloroflexota bacterium]